MRKPFLYLTHLAALLFLSTSALANQFLIFDTTTFLNKPDLAQYGLQTSLKIVSAPQISPLYKDFTQVPSIQALHDLNERLKKDHVEYVVFDFEQWSEADKDADETSSKFLALLKNFRNAVPGVKVGLYGTIPVGNAVISIADAQTGKYAKWQNLNNKFKSLVALVDFVAPVLYTPSNIRTAVEWKSFAEAQVAEARRIAPDKPVYPFIWPVLTHPDRTLDYLPDDFWQLELDTVHHLGDGAILWGGWMVHNKREIWDHSAPWWGAVQILIKR